MLKYIKYKYFNHKVWEMEVQYIHKTKNFSKLYFPNFTIHMLNN